MEAIRIAKDSFVVIEYSLRLDDGSFVKGGDQPASMNFIAGYGQVLPALEDDIMGLEEGVQKELIISAADGFGERDVSLVRTMDYSEFPHGRGLEPNKWAIARNESTGATYSYFVIAKTDSTITVDYNHPLAGKDLYYKIKVVLVRPALDDELEFVKPCEHGSKRED